MSDSYASQTCKETFERTFTWLNGFMRKVLRTPGKTALICPPTGREWTYATLNEEANRLAHALRASGVGRGDAVMYVLPNSAEFVFSYIAARKIGAVGAPLNYRLSSGEISLLINETAPKAIIYDVEFAKVMEEALRLSTHSPDVLIVADLWNKAEPDAPAVSYRDFVADQPSADPELGFEPSIYDVTTRFFTSGTTNLPKSVPVTDLNEVLSAHDVLMHFPLNATDVTMNLTPWFHRGGVHAGGPTPVLYAGGCMVILRDFTPRMGLQFVSQYHITFLIGAPTVFDMLCRLQESTHADISSLRGCVLMGSPLEKEPCERYMRVLTPNIFNGYGTTETFWNTFLRPNDLPDHAGSAGGPCTDDDVRVVELKPDGLASPHELTPRDGSTVGEVIILASAKTAGCYMGNPEMTSRRYHDGWFYTNDLATWDEHGYITLNGRKDDMIVSSGENIYPVQVEAILNEHPKVAESLVLGIPDSKRGSVVVALVKATDASLTEGELKQFCLRHPMLAPYKRPRVFRLVDEIPHNATGKIVRRMPEGITF